jgi:ABC-2 type transport system ATP-binding protein
MVEREEQDDPPVDVEEDVDRPVADDESPVAADEPAGPETDEEPVVPSDRPVVACDTLSRWFGPVIAVNNLTVDIRPGITGLLGPNGAGKTTFMRIAMGLLKPSNGTIAVLGKRPWGNTELLRHIGYVPEKEPPWRDLDGRACAVQAARLSGLSAEEAETAVTKALDEVGLTGVEDRPVDSYSRGMRQRFKFALALLHDPDLYILDEPLLGTDPETRMHLIGVIKDLAGRGKSVLISTHVLTDVEAMTQRIMLMNRGRLMAYGDVTEIRDVLEQYPRTVRIHVDAPRDLGREIWGWQTVLAIEAGEGSVTVKTRDPRGFYEQLQELLVQGKHKFTAVTALDEDLESVFRYLVE